MTGPAGPRPGSVGEPPDLGRAAASVSAVNVASRVTGFARVVATGAALGIALLGDTYQSANVVSNVLFELLAGGLLFAVLVPVFVRQVGEGDRVGATNLAGVLVARATVGLGAVAVVGVALSPLLARALFVSVPGTPPEAQVALATVLLWFVLPQIVLYGVGSILSALLQADHRFVAAAAAPIANNLVVIATMATFVVVHGTGSGLDLTTADEVILGGGTFLGTVAMTAVVVVASRRAGLSVRPRWGHPDVEPLRPLVGQGLWAAGYIGLNQVMVLSTVVLANRVPGGAIAFTTAFTVFLLPHAVLAHPVATALSPRLARHAHRGEDAAFGADLGRGLRLLLVLLVPAAALMAVLARPGLQLVAGLGALDAVRADPGLDHAGRLLLRPGRLQRLLPPHPGRLRGGRRHRPDTGQPGGHRRCGARHDRGGHGGERECGARGLRTGPGRRPHRRRGGVGRPAPPPGRAAHRRARGLRPGGRGRPRRRGAGWRGGAAGGLRRPERRPGVDDRGRRPRGRGRGGRPPRRARPRAGRGGGPAAPAAAARPGPRRGLPVTSPSEADLTAVVVIPVHDGEDRVGATVAAAAALPGVGRVIVVDDASGDASAEVAEAAGAEVVRLVVNRGKAGAVRAGLERVGDEAVVVLLDADLGATAEGAAPLLDAVRDDRCDMAIGVLPGAGRKGGFGLVRRGSAAGIRRACGFDARAPLSGQRAIRTEVLGHLGPAERFGLEVALTIDAVRSGARVLEVDVDIDHAHTGRKLAGFRHRGRQGADIVRALWPRLTTRRARSGMVGLLALAVVLGSLITAPGTDVGRPLTGGADRVVVVGIPGLGLDDLEAMPSLDRLAREGALAATNVRTGGHDPRPWAAYATVSAGVRVDAIPAAAEATGGDGAPVEVPAMAATRAEAGRYLTSEPGALGDALHTAGLRTAVVTQGRPSPTAPTATPSGATLAVADAGGEVDGGDLRAGAVAPTDPGEVADRVVAELPQADVVVVDPGLSVRRGPDGTPGTGLPETDALLGAVADALPEDTMLLVVGVTPPTEEWALTPMVAWGAGIDAHRLASPTTRRDDLVTLSDVGPTVLDALGARPAVGHDRPGPAPARRHRGSRPGWSASTRWPGVGRRSTSA